MHSIRDKLTEGQADDSNMPTADHTAAVFTYATHALASFCTCSCQLE